MDQVLPALVIQEDQLKRLATNDEDGTVLDIVGFRGYLKSLTYSTAAVETETRAQRISGRMRESFFLLVKGNIEGDSLYLPARVTRVTNSNSGTGQRTAVSLKLMANSKQREQLNDLLLRLRVGKEVYRRFQFPITVYFGDTNVEGNVYFVSFFEWQGKAREEFYRCALPNYAKVRDAGIHIITAEASLKFKNQLRLFDDVLINVKVRRIQTSYLELGFEFRNRVTDMLIATGHQILTFSNSKGVLIPVPKEIRKAANVYFDPYEKIIARL